jgi:hypothetical protein
MQQKIIPDSAAQKTSSYVSDLVQRSGGYYSAWLSSSGGQEAVKMPQQMKPQAMAPSKQK